MNGMRIADGAMVRVVEQQGEAAAGTARLTEPCDQGRIVPLVNDDEVGVLAELLGIRLGADDRRMQLRVQRPEGGQSGVPVVGQQVLQAPGRRGFVDRDRVSTRGQLTQHPPQEMRIAMVPAGEQRVREIDDPHARTPLGIGAPAPTSCL